MIYRVLLINLPAFGSMVPRQCHSRSLAWTHVYLLFLGPYFFSLGAAARNGYNWSSYVWCKHKAGLNGHIYIYIFVSGLLSFGPQIYSFPLLQAKFFINILAEPAEVVSLIYVSLLWYIGYRCVLWSLTSHCSLMVNKFMWLTKYIFQLHSQIDGMGIELEKSIRSSVIMVYA
jgi:hypothetical protein